MSNASNAALVQFPQNTGAGETETHFGIGFAAAGAGVLYGSSVFTNVGGSTNRVISPGAYPQFAIGELDINLTPSGTDFESTFLDNILKLYFQNVDHANVGDAAGLQNSAAAGNIYISLHTADPAGGDQTTSEAAYTGYARVAVARGAGTWTVV